MLIRRTQLNAQVLSDEKLLLDDIESYLKEYRPGIVSSYPRPYFRWVIRDSVGIARGLHLEDVIAIRVFVRLRWDIAPGFYKQPTINRLLSNKNMEPQQRFDVLSTPQYAEAWNDAQKYDSPEEWRSRFWEEEP